MQRRVARAAILFAACGHGPPTVPPPRNPPPVALAIDAAPIEPDAPTPLDEDLPRLAAREVQLYDDLAAALAAAGEDCAAAAAKVVALVDANADAIAASAKLSHHFDARDRMRAALEPHRDHLDAAMRIIADARAMRACARHAEFTAALERLRGDG